VAFSHSRRNRCGRVYSERPYSPKVEVAGVFVCDVHLHGHRTFRDWRAGPISGRRPRQPSSRRTPSNPTYVERNVQVQHQITNSLVLDVNYVGNHEYDLFVINPWVNARHLAGGCPGSAPAKRLEPDQQRHLELQRNHRLVITTSEVGPAVSLQLHLQPHERPRVERRRAAIQRPNQLTRRVLEPSFTKGAGKPAPFFVPERFRRVARGAGGAGLRRARNDRLASNGRSRLRLPK